jgi:3-oxoadipate enol-lactonase
MQTKTIQANDIQISYLDEGIAISTPIIFIHGFPFNKWMWENQWTEFKSEHRCIAYDVRGHGDTQVGEINFTVALFAEDLIAFMDVLQIEKAVIVGLSMGGYIAMNAIQKHSHRFAGLVLCDTQCVADTVEGKDKRKKTITFIKRNGLEVYAEESLKNLFAPASFEAKPKAVSFIHDTILNTPAATICHTLQALADRNETCGLLPQINFPVLILVGVEDKITSPEGARKMQELIKGSELVIISEAGHLSNLENPTQFNLNLKEFLKKFNH